MNNQEIIRALKEKASKGDGKKQSQENYKKYVVFNLSGKPFALPAEEVKEISFDNALYYIPFVPPYIRGYANRHGQPYTVLDLKMLFDNELLNSNTLLVLNIQNDQDCLLITDVDEIIKVPEKDIHTLASSDDISRYFLESVTVKEKEIFVLNIATILERLERDLER